MGHRSGGLYRCFEFAKLYEGLQRLLAGGSARARFVQEFVRPSPGDRVLEIGCGTGWLLDLLPRGVDYVGYDSSPRYIATAVKTRGDRGRFLCARVGEIDKEVLGSGFDLVIAIAIVHHLDDAQASILVDSAHVLLRSAGILVTIDPCATSGRSLTARLLMALDRGGNIRTAEGYRALLSRRFPRIEACILTDLLRVPYTHFVARARKD